MNCPRWIPTKFPRFCALHFDKNDIMDGKNNKLQYGAVPVYFNENLRLDDTKQIKGKEKISSLIMKMNQNQLLYSSDSECEYQIVVKVHKKPRKRLYGGVAIRCVYCHKKKDNAVEMQSHLRAVHAVIVEILTPKSVEQYADYDLDDSHLGTSQMCSECGLVFIKTMGEAIAHMHDSHLYKTEIPKFTEDELENMLVNEQAEIMVEEEQEETKPVVFKQEVEEDMYPAVPVTEETLIETSVRTTFKCKLCNRDFGSKRDIRTHIAHEHNAPKIAMQAEANDDSSEEEPETYEPQCYICQAVFNSLSRMRKHVRKSHGTDECYFCSHCTGTFSSLDMYEDHECLEILEG